MLDVDLVELGGSGTLGHLGLGLGGVGIVLERELADLLDSEVTVPDEVAAAEDDGAAHVGGPLALDADVLADDREADSVVATQRVDLVARLGTVEVDAVGIRVEDVVDGQREGIAVVAVDCQDATAPVEQDLAGVAVGNCV